jgi:peptidoglycan/xylan/chitin deacetylase (PgdA/CDA1 family)
MPGRNSEQAGSLAQTVRAMAKALSLALSLLHAAPVLSAQGDANRVAILLYHRFGPVAADSMTVSTGLFEEQLAWLRDNGYQVIPLRQLTDSLVDRAVAIPPRAVAITADDGHESVFTVMFPLIRRYRLPVTLFIYPSAISNASYALTWEQMAEMAGSGLVEMQSHSFWHPNFKQERQRLPAEEYRRFVAFQLGHSKEVLSRHFANPVDMLAWPFGLYDPELERWASEAGYRFGFTLERRAVRVGAEPDLLALPRYLITDLDRGARFAAIVGASGAQRGEKP